MGGALFGYALTFVPDVSGDGISELAIGAAAYDTVSATAAGAAFLYFGGSTPDTTADWTVYGTSSYAQFGYSLAHAANIKGNGEAALAVGAPFDSTGGLSKGSVSLFYKSGSNLSTTPEKLWGENSGDRFGFSVAAGKDQDGNGNTDLLVGAPYYSNGQSHEGRAYLFRGTASGINSTASWTVESDQANAETGFSVAIGDIDGDGKADLLVGSPHYSTTSSSQVATLDASVSGYQNYDHCGSSVAFIEADGIAGRPSAWIVGSPDAHATDGSLTGGTATIWEYLPAVSITVQDGTAIESPAHSGIFRITRTGRTGSDLVVNYTSGGTAICSPSFDYNFYEGGTLKDCSGSFTIPAGSSFLDIEVRPYADFVSEGSETVILILASSSSYKIGTPSSGTVIIFDVPPP